MPTAPAAGSGPAAAHAASGPRADVVMRDASDAIPANRRGNAHRYPGGRLRPDSPPLELMNPVFYHFIHYDLGYKVDGRAPLFGCDAEAGADVVLEQEPVGPMAGVEASSDGIWVVSG